MRIYPDDASRISCENAFRLFALEACAKISISSHNTASQSLPKLKPFPLFPTNTGAAPYRTHCQHPRLQRRCVLDGFLRCARTHGILPGGFQCPYFSTFFLISSSLLLHNLLTPYPASLMANATPPPALSSSSQPPYPPNLRPSTCS